MSIKVLLEDGGLGSGRKVAVTGDNALPVTVVPRRACDQAEELLTRVKYFQGRATDENGSVDLNVDGSVNPVEFLIRPPVGQLISVREIRFRFEGNDLDMTTNDARKFGAAAGVGGLGNGIEAFIEQGGERQDLLVEPIDQMSGFFNYATSLFNVPNAIDVNKDILVWVVDLKLLVPIPLPEAGLDRIVIRVNDDLTAIDLFQVIAVGQREPARGGTFHA